MVPCSDSVVYDRIEDRVDGGLTMELMVELDLTIERDVTQVTWFY